MAISWDFSFEVLDLPKKEARVAAIRTDDTDPTNIMIETYIVQSAILETAEQKSALLDQIWQNHLAFQSEKAQIDSYLGDLAAQAKANLEARE